MFPQVSSTWEGREPQWLLGVGKLSTTHISYGSHLALPAPGVAGIPISHPHALEGIVGNFPFMPDAGEKGWQSNDVGASGADLTLLP